MQFWIYHSSIVEERALFITSMLLLQNLLLQHTNKLTDRLLKQHEEAAGKVSRACYQVSSTAVEFPVLPAQNYSLQGRQHVTGVTRQILSVGSQIHNPV